MGYNLYIPSIQYLIGHLERTGNQARGITPEGVGAHASAGRPGHVPFGEYGMSTIIKVDKYETKLINGQPVTFAICGKHTLEMPSCYADMYDDHHLAVVEQTLEMPEVYSTTKTHYAPLRTD